MVILSFGLLLMAALLGAVLAAVHLGASRTGRLPWPVWAMHGVLGMAGFVALLAGLHGPPRPVALGVAGFGRIAAALLALALLAGLWILAERLRRRPLPVLTVGLHATLAIGAVVVLAAYTMVG